MRGTFTRKRMKLIVGLGNPDVKYAHTYHNLGFMAVDRVAESLGVEIGKKKCLAKIAEAFVGGEKVILAQPQTYMNLSGKSVSELVRYYRVKLSDLVVIYDDFDLPKGALRIRKDGSAGTHNGMRDIVYELDSAEFARIRIGFRSDDAVPLIDRVLSAIAAEDRPLFDRAIGHAADAALAFAKGDGWDTIMQKYNAKG